MEWCIIIATIAIIYALVLLIINWKHPVTAVTYLEVLSTTEWKASLTVKKEVEEIAQRSISLGKLYTDLESLERQGLIVSRQVVPPHEIFEKRGRRPVKQWKKIIGGIPNPTPEFTEGAAFAVPFSYREEEKLYL